MITGQCGVPFYTDRDRVIAQLCLGEREVLRGWLRIKEPQLLWFYRGSGCLERTLVFNRKKE